MKYEELILARHRFNDRLTQFLDLISRMDDREIEQALGRLLDTLKDAKTDFERAHVQLRGEVIQAYYALRKTGGTKQKASHIFRSKIPSDVTNSFPKKISIENTLSYRLRCATDATLISEDAFNALNQILERPVPEQVKLLAP